MYSVVLMMALSGGAESVDFGRCNGCARSHGCHAVSTCASSGHGCHGGGLLSRFGCHRSHGCNGCHAAVASHGCHGGGCHASHGCSSSCHGCHGGLFSRLHNRCHGCHGCSAAACSSGCNGTVVVPEKMKVMPKKDGKEQEVSNASPATIVVTLPAGARLTVDGNATRSTSDRRTFVTPALETDADYVYNLQAEVVVNGQVAAQTQNVTVRAGQTTEVSFTFASQGVASR